MKNLLKRKVKDTLNIGLVSLEGDKQISIMKNFLEFVFKGIKINVSLVNHSLESTLTTASKPLDLLLFSDNSENYEEYLSTLRDTGGIGLARLSKTPRIFFGAWSLIGWYKNRPSSIVKGVVGHDKGEHYMETSEGNLFLIPSNHKELMMPFKGDKVVANASHFLSNSYVAEKPLPSDYVEPEIITIFNKYEDKGLFFQYDLKPLMSEPKFSEALNYTAFLIINTLITITNE